jgi:hypothetical protein
MALISTSMAECRLFEGSGFVTQNNSEIAAFVEKLAEVGSHYRMDEMEELYSEDLAFLVLTPDGKISRFSKAGIFEEQGNFLFLPQNDFFILKSREMKPLSFSFAR